jgi:LSD1 subclass zinc finger protein
VNEDTEFAHTISFSEKIIFAADSELQIGMKLIYWNLSWSWMVLFGRSANQIAHLTCGQCRTTLMHPPGASTVQCATCRYVNHVRVCSHLWMFLPSIFLASRIRSPVSLSGSNHRRLIGSVITRVGNSETKFPKFRTF